MSKPKKNKNIVGAAGSMASLEVFFLHNFPAEPVFSEAVLRPRKVGW